MILLRWLLNTFILILVAYLTPGIELASFWSALIAALVLGLLNALIRPVLILFTFPINIITLGLFTLIINGLIFWLASSIVRGFDITNFTAAFFGALIYTIIALLIGLIGKR